MKQQIEKKLKTMMNREFLYGGHHHMVIDYNINEETQKVVLHTNIRRYERPFENFKEFAANWIPITTDKELLESENSKDSSSNLIIPETENILADDMINILRDNIARVQQDSSYINIAKAVNNNVNSIIHVAKLKLDYYKAFKKAK